MTEHGWILANTQCPECNKLNIVSVFGGNSDVINKGMTCASCNTFYSSEITISFSCSVVNFPHVIEEIDPEP